MLWNMLFGLCILGTVRYGDFITDECPQAGYACPKYCDVDHKHLPLKECKNGKDKQESRPDSTAIPSSRQYDKEAMADNKSERL